MSLEFREESLVCRSVSITAMHHSIVAFLTGFKDLHRGADVRCFLHITGHRNHLKVLFDRQVMPGKFLSFGVSGAVAEADLG